MYTRLLPLLMLSTSACDAEEFATEKDLDDVSEDVSGVTETAAQAVESNQSQDSQIASLSDSAQSMEARITDLEASLASAQGTIEAIEDQLGAGGDTSVEAQLALLSEVDSGLQASIDGLATEISIQGQRGEIWSTTGASVGRCASLAVAAPLDRPLFILANVEVSATTSSGACYSSLGTRCTGEPDSFASSASAATISLLDSSNGVVGSTEVTGDFETDANLVAYTSLTDYAFGHQRTLAQSITLPMAWVYEIPLAGTYTVNLDVVTDGEVDGCSLTVLQP